MTPQRPNRGRYWRRLSSLLETLPSHEGKEIKGKAVALCRSNPSVRDLANSLRAAWKLTRPTVRNSLRRLRSLPHGIDLASFSRWTQEREDTSTETDFRYGSDFNDEKTLETATLVSHRHLSGSDYSGGTVVLANQKDAQGMADDSVIVRAHGGYNTLAVWFRLDVRTDSADAIAEMLAGLDDYPIIDESTLSEIEHEREMEDWESYGQSDFLRALETEHGIERDSLEIDADALSDLWRTADNGQGLVTHEESPGVYFDVDRAAEAISAPILFYVSKLSIDFPDTVSLMETDEGKGEAYRLLRLSMIGETLRRLEDKTIKATPSKGLDPENGPASEQKRYPIRQAILSASIEAGDTNLPLDREAVDRESKFTVEFSRYRYEPTAEQPFGGKTETLTLTLSTGDFLTVYDGTRALASFLSR